MSEKSVFIWKKCEIIREYKESELTTDVTQINIGGSKIYLSPVLDMFNGEILSYAISDSPNLKMVMDMLNQLYDEVGSTEGMLMHSDQGWHYQHAAYQRSLKTHILFRVCREREIVLTIP